MNTRESAPSEAIVLGIAERTGEDPLEMPPLYNAVDPEALNQIIEGSDSTQVTFEYAGYEVTTSGRDQIIIHEVEHNPSQDRSPEDLY